MNGVDVIAFTAGIGENDGRVREMVGQYFDYLGASIDPEKNAKRGEEIIISKPGDKVTVVVIPTNKENIRNILLKNNQSISLMIRSFNSCIVFILLIIFFMASLFPH